MQHSAKQVQATAGRHGLSEVATNSLIATIEVELVKEVPGRCRDVREVEKNPARSRRSNKESSKERSLAPTYIDDRSRRPRVRGNDGFVLLPSATGNRGIEDLGLVWMVGIIGIDRTAVNVDEGRFASSNSVKQMSPGSPVRVLVEHNDKGAQGSPRVATQRLGKRREAKPTGFIFHKDPEAGEKSKNAMKRIRVYPDSRSDFGWAACLLGDQVSNAQFGSHVERLCHPRASRHLSQRYSLPQR
jgi:hypothetical protein